MDIAESLQMAGVPACAVDETGRISVWNQEAAEFFGIPSGYARGREWHTVVRPNARRDCCPLCETRAALRAGRRLSPLEAVLRVRGVDNRVTVIPLPLRTDRSDLAFLMVVGGSGMEARDEEPVSRLTHREREILAYLARGWDARRIAAVLDIRYSTARNHVQNILNKLDAHSKAEAVAYAFENGLAGRKQPA